MNAITEDVFARRPQTAFQIIDAHAHAGPYSLFFIPDSDPASMVRVMDRCGVSHAVFSSHLAIQLDAPAGNDAVAAAVRASGGRLSGYCTINPWQDPEAELARWANDPRFVGIKLHPDLHEYPLTGPRYAEVWRHAERTGCPVLTHTWHGSAYDCLSMVDTVAEKYPEAVILTGHSGAMPSGFDSAIEVAKRRPQVILEICGSFNTGATIRRMVDEVGAQQVVFGSDFPFIDLRISLGRVVFSGLGEDDLAAVLGGTMSNLLRRRQAVVT